MLHLLLLEKQAALLLSIYNYLFVFVCFVNNAAAELPDRHPRERSSHQGSGGEGGFPGG